MELPPTGEQPQLPLRRKLGTVSKQITSPFKKWAGTVTIADPLTMSQAHAIEAAMTKPEDGEDGRVWLTVIDDMQLPAIFACVEKWELENMPKDLSIHNFPASPRVESHKLIEWLFTEVRKVYFGESVVPNG